MYIFIRTIYCTIVCAWYITYTYTHAKDTLHGCLLVRLYIKPIYYYLLLLYYYHYYLHIIMLYAVIYLQIVLSLS